MLTQFKFLNSNPEEHGLLLRVRVVIHDHCQSDGFSLTVSPVVVICLCLPVFVDSKSDFDLSSLPSSSGKLKSVRHTQLS